MSSKKSFGTGTFQADGIFRRSGSEAGWKWLRKLSWFTLAELIVVISILAVLATIGLLALSGYSNDAKDAALKANVRSIVTAISSEAAITGNSPRYYVVHDQEYALSGAFLYVDGNPVALTGGDIGQPPADSNYTAGKPDFLKLKLDSEKFRISSIGLSFMDSVHSAFDPGAHMAGAVDVQFPSAKGYRNANYFQVAAISPDTGAVSVSGNFPAPTPEDLQSGSVAGLLKNPNAVDGDAGTAAILDGQDINVAPLASCDLPWGGKIVHGGAVTAYQASSAPFGSTCAFEQRKCDDGILSGSFEIRSCSVTAAASCSLPWGWTVPHGNVVTAYSETSIPFSATHGCSDRKQDRECVDGNLSWNEAYSNESCVKGDPSPCSANASYVKNGRTYSVPALAHGEDSGTVVSANVNENNGTFRYSLTLSCNDGAYANENESEAVLVSCAAGYSASGNSCVPSDCSGATRTVNGRSYSVPPLVHGTSTTITIPVTVTGGIQPYSQNFSCALGTISESGSEQMGVLACSSGYNAISWSCVPVSCLAIKTAYPTSISQPYVIDPDGTNSAIAAFTAYCDMNTDGGGWTLIMKWYGWHKPDQASWRSGNDYNPSDCWGISGSVSCRISDAKINAIRSGGSNSRYRAIRTVANQKAFWSGDCTFNSSTLITTWICGAGSSNIDLSWSFTASHAASYWMQLYTATWVGFLPIYTVSDPDRRYVWNGYHHGDITTNYLDTTFWVR